MGPRAEDAHPEAMGWKAFLFDNDGTLLDTNTAHVNAWHRALLRLGHEIPLERIAPEIGKGGDKLVPALLGEALEREQGEQIRQAETEEFLAIAARTRFVLFEGVQELLQTLRQRGIRTCIATSSSEEHFDAMYKESGLNLRPQVDRVITKRKSMESKPAPDLIQAAVEQLGMAPQDCVMVGDTPHDGEASRRAGVAFIGLLCGGNARETLERAGAQRIYRWPRELLRDLDQLL